MTEKFPLYVALRNHCMNPRINSMVHRYLVLSCLFLASLLLPGHGAWANNACVNAGQQVILDSPPTSYAPPGAVGDIVWWGPVHAFTVTCGFPQGSVATAQGGYISLNSYNPDHSPITTAYPNLQLGALVGGSAQVWYGGTASSVNWVRVPGVTVPPCALGVPKGACPKVTFQITEQLNLRNQPGAPISKQWTNGFTFCVVSNVTNNWVGCGNGNDGGPSLWLVRGGAEPAPITKTCGFRANNLTIPLGSYQDVSLPSVGQGTPWKTGELISTGCTNVTQLNMTFSGTPDTSNGNLFQAQGGATGVGIQLQTGAGGQIVPNALSPVTFAPQPAGGTYPFQARYVRTTAPVNPGPGNAHVTVNITYQ